MFGLVKRNTCHMIGMWSRLAACTVQNFSQTASRNTVIVERWWQVPLSKEGSPPRLNPRRHRVYRLVEDTKHGSKEKMELLLTQTVPKLGGRGDTVFVAKSLGRNKLLPQGLAVYPSPENLEMFTEEKRQLREGKPEDRIQTRTGQKTLEFLRNAKLEVPINTSMDYHISKEIVCRYFQTELGVVVPTHALTLPDEPITTVGETWCEVTINGVDTVRITLSVKSHEDYKPRQLRRRGQEPSPDTKAEGSSPSNEDQNTQL
ncbi:39S ribosomal protein L9, mitochondrial [Alosa alosa]|uniref:39S ribosomal protein L9, mitochondrial n=1 Tax=Alosa alosa TaxID=278164 RepID=UPI00201546D8|nr:39S ribosomal protein L9, mitochondrial [Alosa alosa]